MRKTRLLTAPTACSLSQATLSRQMGKGQELYQEAADPSGDGATYTCAA